LRLSSASEQSTSTGNELLADIQHVFDGRQVKKISTVDLIEALENDPEKSWATYNRGRSLTPRQLARQLAAYGIKSKTVRLGHANTPKGYDEAQFADVFARYLTPKNLPQQCNDLPEIMRPKAPGVADDLPQIGNASEVSLRSDEPSEPDIGKASAAWADPLAGCFDAATGECLVRLNHGGVAEVAADTETADDKPPNEDF
jgi:putative DNA primase/helicase